MSVSEKRIRDNLLTWDEFQKDNISDPYIFRIEKNDQQLVYFGMRHSFDPDDPVFDELRTEWSDFFEKTNRNDAMVVVEGEERPLGQTERDAITNKGGEGGFITYLANAERVERIAPEPSVGKILDKLAEKYPKNQVFYYYAAQIMYQWNSLSEKPDFADYLHYFLQNAQRETGWNDTNFSLDSLKKIHNELFETPFDHTNREFYFTIINPAEDETPINKIAREADMIKDIAVVREIHRLWEEGRDIFVVYGIGHAIMQEPALESQLQGTS